ncbi:MAG: hypothetical protein P1P90_00025 [Patescibacteria group bacterium]|nr:hypothetical protein [Patescibacteria group bacterium]
MKEHPSSILEGYLITWEKTCELYNVKSKIEIACGAIPRCPITGPVAHWRSLRTGLLDNSKEHFIDNKYQGDENHQKLFGPISLTPYIIAEWSRSSRRVFALDRTLQDLLACTSLEHMCWGDVSWPFESFVVELANPLEVSGELYDAIIVSRSRAEMNRQRSEFLLFTILSRKFRSVRPIQVKDRKLFARDLKRKDIDTYLKRMGSASAFLQKIPFKGFTLRVPDIRHESVSTMVKSLLDKQNLPGYSAEHASDTLYDTAAHIVIGLCLYLTTLTPKDRERVVQRDPPPQRKGIPDSKAIFLESDVMHVKSIHMISNEEQKLFREVATKGEQADIRAHFRRGHWRRAPGSGNDPDAPKIVHVRPCLVRKDRLLAGMIPGGATSKVQ